MAEKISTKKSKNLLLSAFIVLVAFSIIGITLMAGYIKYLRKAHSTFENYYVFRGCTQLLQKTDTYAYCKVSGGKTIKLVMYQGRWYLDGDLPICKFGFCF